MTTTDDAQSALAIRTSIDQVEGALTEFDKISAGLAALELAHPKNLACDVATTAGMRDALAGRAAWRDPRIAVEKARKAAKAPVLELGRDIDKRASYITELLQIGESNYDDQIKAEEKRREDARQIKIRDEMARVALIQAAISSLSVAPQTAALMPAEITAVIDRLQGREIGDEFEEFKIQAAAAKDASLGVLRSMWLAAVSREEENAKLAAAAEAEAAERGRIAADQARVAAEQKAEADRLAAERAQFEAEQAKAREVLEAEQASVRAEQKRLVEAAAAEQTRKAREAQEQREAADREVVEQCKARIAAEDALGEKMRAAAPQLLLALSALLAAYKVDCAGNIDRDVVRTAEFAISAAT